MDVKNSVICITLFSSLNCQYSVQGYYARVNMSNLSTANYLNAGKLITYGHVLPLYLNVCCLANSLLSECVDIFSSYVTVPSLLQLPYCYSLMQDTRGQIF
jgi:hypothetical protein